MGTCSLQPIVLGRLGCVAASALVLLGTPAPPAVAQEAPHIASVPFRPAPPLRSYVAIRRLESSNERHDKQAWLVARTELRSDGTFSYRVLDEGGSELIRKRVLHPALEREAEVHRSGRSRRGGLTPENYEFAAPQPAGDVVQVALTPRRKEEMLVKGTMTTSADGELLRVEGELVKRPSFWTRSVHLVRKYGRVDGTHVPVRLDTRAQVLMVGPSTLSMTYEYVEINGQPVSQAGRRSPETARLLAASDATGRQ